MFRHAHAVKVGMTCGPPEARRLDIERAAGIAVEHVAAFPVKARSRARVIEAWALHRLREHRTFGEWHSCDVATALAVVEWAVERAPSLTPDATAQLSRIWQDRLDTHIGNAPA